MLGSKSTGLHIKCEVVFVLTFVDDTLETCRIKRHVSIFTYHSISPLHIAKPLEQQKPLQAEDNRHCVGGLTDHREQTTGDSCTCNQDEDDDAEQSSRVLSLGSPR